MYRTTQYDTVQHTATHCDTLRDSLKMVLDLIFSFLVYGGRAAVYGVGFDFGLIGRFWRHIPEEQKKMRARCIKGEKCF